MLDFSREALKPENTQMAMCLAPARRARVTLRLAVQCGLAPSCTRSPFLPAVLFHFFPLIVSAIVAPRVLGGTIDRLVVTVVSVESGILLIFVGKFNAPPLSQATCTVPKPVRS
jgi:hypothetical protein